LENIPDHIVKRILSLRYQIDDWVKVNLQLSGGASSLGRRWQDRLQQKVQRLRPDFICIRIEHVVEAYVRYGSPSRAHQVAENNVF
jgi:hypothetical protein